MPTRAVITGLGVVSAAGVTREAFFEALATGTSGVREVTRGDITTQAGVVDDFGAKRVLDPRSLRRLARLSQLALVAAKEALAQSALEPDPLRAGIVLGTGLGTMRETMDFIRGYVTSGPEAASPLLFPTSVMNAAAGQMAIELGLRGVNSTVNHRDASAADALMFACDLLALGRADALLVGAVDELSDVALFGMQRLGALARTGMRPYALGRDGAAPGECAAVLIVEREADAARRGARVLARVESFAASGERRPRVGWGHADVPGAEAEAARTIRAALDDAGLDPDAIDYVAGGGSGQAVDAIEARAVARALERPVPHGSILGQTGECMATGALRIASALYAFERQALPGTVGAGEPDPAAPVPGLVREPRAARVRAVLVPTVAQGGSNSALVLCAPASSAA